ncbi:MAG TPA: iron-sulfur cluster co-chaperone HscB C-terminal domain-containing protein [Azospirillaceae bacterium]|nr:iron-sulfur cluster co-chaperone HscB C-terminal domain-containing protein [Azospirillaceae bacterium]
MSKTGNGRGPGPGVLIEGDLIGCWLCQRALSPRALFCHACGALQPLRALDPFARLNLERRFDIGQEQLERQYTGLRRTLDPQRFATRVGRERQHAREHLDALTKAYEILKDPVRRARWLLDQEGVGVPTAEEADAADPDMASEVVRLRHDLATAEDVNDIDVVAARVTRNIEGCLKRLAVAFRNGDLALAAIVLVRMSSFEAVAEEARSTRSRKTPV